MIIDSGYQQIEVIKLSPAEMRARLDRDTSYILDVRPKDFERDSSFVGEAHHVPLVLLADQLDRIPRDREILITDWAMKQSPMAAKYLITKGFTVAGVLQGGVERWKSEGLPLEERQVGETVPATRQAGN